MSASTREYLEQLAAVRVQMVPEPIVVTTMTSAKTWPLLSDHILDFHYLPSAMSHAGDIALGLALARPERKVICLNGDGSLLMNLGALVTAVENRAKNLVMLVMENGAYDVVGGSQVPGARRTDFAAMAQAAGWSTCRSFLTANAFADALPELLSAPGPVFTALAVRDPPTAEFKLPSEHPRDALRNLKARLSRSR